MTTAIEEGEGLLRSVKLSVSNAKIQSQAESRLREMSGKMNVKGFRPGHVPHGEAKRRFGTQIEEEVKHQAMADEFLALVKEQSIRLVGPPKFKPATLITDAEQYRFEVEFEVLPVFELADFLKLQIDQPEAEVVDSDVNENIESFRRHRQTFEEAEGRAAESGDRLTLDWSSTAYDADNKPHEDRREDATLVLDEKALPEPLAVGLKGAKAGDERVIEMPHQVKGEATDDQQPRKPAVIKCEVKSIAVPKLPPLDAEFIEGLGLDGVKDVADFRVHVKQSLSRGLRDALWQNVKSQVLSKLAGLHSDLMLPQTLIEYESERMKEAATSGDGATKMTGETEAQMRQSATESVRLQLVVEKIIRDKKIEVEPDDVKARIEQLAEGHPEPQQVIEWYYRNDEQLKRIENMVLEDKVVSWVVDQAQVKTVKMGYAEAVQASGARFMG